MIDLLLVGCVIFILCWIVYKIYPFILPTLETIEFVERCYPYKYAQWIEHATWSNWEDVFHIGGLTLSMTRDRKIRVMYDNDVDTYWSKGYLHNLANYFSRNPVQKWYAYHLAKLFKA